MISHLVIGGGLAGAGVATLLAQQGHAVTVLEKQPTDMHKVCGEFISIEAQHYLHALGLDLDRLGAVPIRRVRIIHGQQMSDATLPFIGKSLTRHRLDGAVRQMAVKQGVSLRMGCEAMRIAPFLHGLQVELPHHEILKTPNLYLASGKHDVRGWRRKSARRSSIGFKMLWRLSPATQAALRDTVELYLFEGGYAGLEPVEDGYANLCLAVTAKRLAVLGKRWSTLLANWMAASPLLAERFNHAIPCWDKPLAVAGIPYGFVHRPAAQDPSSLYRLGDQMAVIPSFCGDGMAMALHSAFLAAQAVDASSYHAQARADFLPLIRRACGLNHILHTWVGRHGFMMISQYLPALLSQIAQQTRVQAGLVQSPRKPASASW
jgi:flavin-dependent dehydrogenase